MAKHAWEDKIPEGWERVTRGEVREDDMLWWITDRKFHPVPENVNGRDIGDRCEDKHCVIRRVKAKPVKKPEPVEAIKAPARQFVLIEKDRGGVPLDERLGSGVICGPFDSVTVAEAFVKAGAEEHYEPGEGGDPAEWGQDYVLCEVIGILRPVPKAEVTINVERRGV